MTEDARTIYEFSKLTNTTKQIVDDFNSSIIMLIFTEFLKGFDNEKEDVLEMILDRWEKTIIINKEREIDTLSNQVDSMIDMTLGTALAGTEDLDKYRDDVVNVKGLLRESILRGIGNE